MPKFVYLGKSFPYGPYRGESPEIIADQMAETIEAVAKEGKIKPEDARKDFLKNLKGW